MTVEGGKIRASSQAPKRKGSTQKHPSKRRKEQEKEIDINEGEFVLNTGDIANIRETDEHDRKKATLTDYRGRILSFIVYIATEYP